jgi:PEP-CTERM motif-containing protein
MSTVVLSAEFKLPKIKGDEMMKKIASLLAVAALMMALNTEYANAYTFAYSFVLNGTEFTSKYSRTLNDYQLLAFNNGSLGDVNSSSTKSGLPWTWTGNATVVNGSLSGQYPAPYGLGAVDTFQLGKLYNFFGLWWGSVDSFNTLSFYDGFKMKCTQYAFEDDNIAVGNIAPVPEPGTMALLGIGMLGLVVYGKRRMN